MLLCNGVAVILSSVVCSLIALETAGGATVSALDGWLVADALSGVHLLLLGAVFSLSSVHGVRFFGREVARDMLTLAQVRRLVLLWQGTMAAMLLLLLSDDLGLMWVGMELATLLTAFLIAVRLTKPAVEAMWKYLLLTSVGMAFAFLGILLVAAAVTSRSADGGVSLRLSQLMGIAGGLDPTLLKLGFVCLLVGYGTKVGLAPMHNWLPDAHSQAPAPISAMFSGIMLNTALYCILRYLPLLSAVGAWPWAGGLMVILGLLSLIVAATFMVHQRDLKRLLAYSSIEHMGLMTLGIGLGGIGIYAAMLHGIGHAAGKSGAFLAAGKLGQSGHAYDLKTLSGIIRTTPLWGGAMLLSLLALLGLAPFVMFLSELLVIQAALAASSPVPLLVVLVTLGIIFAATLRVVVILGLGPREAQQRRLPTDSVDVTLAVAPLALLLLLGLWLPAPLVSLLSHAAAIVGGG